MKGYYSNHSATGFLFASECRAWVSVCIFGLSSNYLRLLIISTIVVEIVWYTSNISISNYNNSSFYMREWVIQENGFATTKNDWQ